MRTSFHHQPEAQRPNFQLFASWQADYPIFRGKADNTIRGVQLCGFFGNARCLHINSISARA